MLFRGSLDFLSNMYNCTVEYNGCTYRCAESAFQAQKCADEEEKKLFNHIDGFLAKKYGKKVSLRKDWNAVRVSIMEEIIREKFLQHPDLARKLAEVEGVISEDNYWKDTFWGVCNGEGKNNLGKILMKIRDELREVTAEIKIYISSYEERDWRNIDVYPIGVSKRTPIDFRGDKFLKLIPSENILKQSNKKIAENIFGHYLMTLDANKTISELTQISKGKDIVLLGYRDKNFNSLIVRWLKWATNKEVIEI